MGHVVPNHRTVVERGLEAVAADARQRAPRRPTPQRGLL